MTFHHRPTFLRSLILENPSALGDYFGPEDVLRMEEEFPELFEHVLEPVDHHHEGSSKQTTTSKPLQKPPPPTSKSSLTLRQPKLGNVKSTTTNTNIRKPPATTTTTNATRKKPFERLSQHTLKTSQCNRERCKTQSDVKPTSASSSFGSVLKPNVQSSVSNLNTKSKYSSLSERILSNSIINDNNHTLSLDNFEYEHDRRRRMNPEKTRVVRVTNRNRVSTTSGVPEKPYDSSNNISSKVKLQQPSSISSISRKRPLISSPTKTINTSTIAFSTPPSTPRFKPVSERHNVHASKSIGFLKPAPILVKRRKNQVPNTKLKTPSPSVKFLDKNVIKGYGINTKTNINSSSHHQHHRPPPHERIQSQSDTVVGGGMSSNNFLTLPALKKLVEERFGHYLKPSNSSSANNNQNKNETEQNLNQQQHKHIDENSTKMEQQQEQQKSMYNNNNIRKEKDLNISELSDILEGIETENTDSFSSIVTLTSLGDGDNNEEVEQKDELISTVPLDYNCNFNSSDVRPRRVINIKSQSLQQQIQSQKEEQEEYLTNASVDRCEQLLLAKLLASKYEKDGKFRKTQTLSPRKTTISTLQPPPPFHSQLLDNFEKYNKAFEVAVKENPDLLQKIAHELIHAEVKKIMEEEHDIRFNYPTTTTTTTTMTNGRNEKLVSIDPKKYSGIPKQVKIKVQRNSAINEEKSKYTFNAEYSKYRDASVNVSVHEEVDSKDDKVSFDIPTPDLTPPHYFQNKISSQDQIIKETKNSKTKLSKHVKDSSSKSNNSNDNSSSLSPVKTPTLSKMESLVHQIQCLELSVQNKQQIEQKTKQKQTLDMTDCDCSELEDFVASEKDVIDDDKPHRIIHDIIEECITNIPTPELTTPSLSEHSLGRTGEILKQILSSPEKGNVVSIPQNHHQQIAIASSLQEKRDEDEKKAIKIVKDVIKIDLNVKTKEPASKIQEPKQIIHHPSTDEIPCSSTNNIIITNHNNNKEDKDDDLFYDYSKEKEMLEEIINQSQSEDDIKRRKNKNQKIKGSKNTTFDMDFEASEFSDSSLTSILELISDGELILNFNEEKSPGEISLSGATFPYYNISPGIHQRIDCPTTTTSEFHDSSTFNATGINDSNLSQSSGIVYE